MAKVWSGLVLGGAAVLVAAPAFAQQAPLDATSQSAFTRDRNVSVTERARPGYDPVPVPLGGFTGLPRLDVGAEQNDNIYATDTGKHSDTIFTINPELDLASNWTRNALGAYVRAASREYSRYTAESTTDWQVGAQGRLDLGAAGNLSAGADTGEFTEPRTATNTAHDSVHPIRYDQTDAFLSGQQEFNRIRLSGRFDYNDLNYMNGTDPNGLRIFEDPRDHTTDTVTGKAEYAVSPAAAVFFDAAYNTHDYSLTPPATTTNRNSHGETFDVGANFDLSHVARGQIEIGYLTQQFASTFGTISGLNALGKVEWFPTQLTTVTLTGSRTLQDAAVVGSPAYTAENVGLQADHELLRNMILTARVGFEDDNYDSVARKDTTTNGYVAARYLVNRVVGLTLSYTYLDQESSGAAKGPKYIVNRIAASTSLKF